MKNYKNNIEEYLSLYLVTDRTWCINESLEEQVTQALEGGVSCLQVREKKMSDDNFIEISKSLKKIANKYQIPLIINDSIEVFKAVDADGIHVGQDDLESSKVRSIIGPNKILGVSVQNIDQAKYAQKSGADYLGVGSIFPTKTKTDAYSLNPQILTDISNSVKIPVIAIGGINEKNIFQLKDSSIKGVALVSAILKSNNIKNTTRNFRNIIKHII